MDNHVWVNPDRFQEVGEEIQVDGVDCFVQLSPYHVPTEITGRYSQRSKKFEIKFHYINSEKPTKHQANDSGIQLVLGEHTGKILKIIIPINEKPLDSVGVIKLRTEIVEALKSRSEQVNPWNDNTLPFGQYLNNRGVLNTLESEEGQALETLTKELVAN